MAKVCFFTGKIRTIGNQYTRRGKAKYLGGIGRKTTGCSKRSFKPNLQRVKCVIDGEIMTVQASAKAIRMGLVIKPVKKKPFEMDKS